MERHMGEIGLQTLYLDIGTELREPKGMRQLSKGTLRRTE